VSRRALALHKASLVNLAPETARGHVRDVKRFLEWCPRRLDRVRRRNVEAYLVAMGDSGVSARTQRSTLQRLRRFFRLMVAEGRLRTDPTEGITIQVGQRAPRRLLSRAEVGRLLEAASRSSKREPVALRNRALLELLYGLGLRRKELVEIRLGDLDLKHGVLLVRRAKRGESRVLPLHKATLDHVRAYLEKGRPALRCESDRLFVSVHSSGLHTCTVGQIVRKVARLAGVEGCHPHAFRRALATHLIEEGVNLRAVQLLLGHADLKATQLYLSVDRRALRKVVGLLETRPR